MNRNYLRLDAAAAGDGVRNIGYNNGVAVKAGAKYDGSIWARSTTAQDLTVRVENEAGDAVLATGTVAVDGSDTWKKYDVDAHRDRHHRRRPARRARRRRLDGPPRHGLARCRATAGSARSTASPCCARTSPRRSPTMKPVASSASRAAASPTSARSGRYEESGYTDRRRTYQWKETIGPVEERPTNWNFWGYNQSYGIGYLEYFELAEDLGAEPLPVLSVGANGCGGTIRRDARPRADRSAGSTTRST